MEIGSASPSYSYSANNSGLVRAMEASVGRLPKAFLSVNNKGGPGQDPGAYVPIGRIKPRSCMIAHTHRGDRSLDLQDETSPGVQAGSRCDRAM